MGNNSLTNITATDMTNTVTSYSVTGMSTDGAGDQKETEYQITNFSSWLGYYKTIPELKMAIDTKATWTVGKGFKSIEPTKLCLLEIKGFGKDSFNSILANQIRVYHIAGDSFAEVIRDKKGQLVNLKPLDPSTIKIIANQQGIIKRYEQVSKIMGQASKKFKPAEILHLSRNRVADEIHGVSLIEAVENIILMRNEAMSDMKTLMHRHVRPMILWKLDTDDTTQISNFKSKADNATNKGENMIIPMGSVEHELVTVPTNSTLNPLPWINQLNNYFFQACGVPQIIVGGSQEITEATAKIAYLAFEQTIEEEQLYIEEQILNQLGLEIELDFPATLQNELLSDMSKEESMQAATPEDTSLTEAV